MIKTLQPISMPKSAIDASYSWPLIMFYIALMLQTNYVNKATILVSILILLVLNYKKEFLNFNQISQLSALLALEIIGILSYFWSFVPYQTLIYVLNDLELFIMAFLVAQYSIQKNIAISLKFCAKFIILITSFYSILFFGDSMSPIGLKSFYTHKNGLGSILAINLLFLIYARNLSKFDIFLILIGIISMVLSQSKTSIGLFFIIILITSFITLLRYFYRDFSSYTQGFIKLFSKIIPVVLSILIILMVVFREEVSRFLVEIIPNELFTGRGLLWITVLTRTRDDLLLGIGPGAFWGSGGAERLSEIAQTQLYVEDWIQRLKAGDGGYIDIIGSHGYVGLALLFFSLMQVYKLIIHHASHSAAKPAFLVITFFVFHNITETDNFGFTNIFWFFFQFFMIYLVMLPKDKNL